MKTGWIRNIAALALAVVAGHAMAQAPRTGSVESRLEARRVVAGADGKESLQPATQARPGDVIEYVASYRNTSGAAVRDLEATLPVPGNTEYLPGSASPGAVRGSLDGQAYAPLPLKRKVLRNGVEVEESVPPSLVRSLRWTAPLLAAGQTLTFSARVRVVDDRGTGPPPTPQAGAR